MNVSEEVFARRCERMVQLITMGGPRIMIGKEAQLIAQALEHPWKYAVRQGLWRIYAVYLRLRYGVSDEEDLQGISGGA